MLEAAARSQGKHGSSSSHSIHQAISSGNKTGGENVENKPSKNDPSHKNSNDAKKQSMKTDEGPREVNKDKTEKESSLKGKGQEGTNRGRDHISKQDHENDDDGCINQKEPSDLPKKQRRKKTTKDDEINRKGDEYNNTDKNKPVTMDSGNNKEAIHTDDETDSPIKHIAFAKVSKRSTADEIGGERNAPSYLDDTTLNAFKSYLVDRLENSNDHPSSCISFESSHLDEDEIAKFMMRMNRLASRQADYHHRLVAESDESDTSLFHEILDDEEEFTIGHSFFKQVLAEVKAANPQVDLDSRTAGWIKRAAGLYRNKTDSQLRENAIGKHGRKHASSVKTRNSALRDKVERRDKVLRSFAAAVDDLELDFGPFEKRKSRKNTAGTNNNGKIKRRRSPSPYSADDERVAATNSRNKKRRGSAAVGSSGVLHALVQRKRIFHGKRHDGLETTPHAVVGISQTTVVVSKVIIDGKRWVPSEHMFAHSRSKATTNLSTVRFVAVVCQLFSINFFMKSHPNRSFRLHRNECLSRDLTYQDRKQDRLSLLQATYLRYLTCVLWLGRNERMLLQPPEGFQGSQKQSNLSKRM